MRALACNLWKHSPEPVEDDCPLATIHCKHKSTSVQCQGNRLLQHGQGVLQPRGISSAAVLMMISGFL